MDVAAAWRRAAGAFLLGVNMTLEQKQAPPTAIVLWQRDYPAATVLSLLARSGYAASEREAGELSLDLARHLGVSIVVAALDEDEQGWEFLRQLAQRARSPVLALLPQADQAGQALALEAGAEACVRDEDLVTMLPAQLKAISRRVQLRNRLPSLYRVRDLTIDMERFQVLREGRQVPLSPTEFRMLAYLAQNGGKVVSAVELLGAVSTYEYTKQEAQELAKVYVRRLRQKLEREGLEQPYIRNLRGAGYMLERRARPRPGISPRPAASGE